MCGIMPCMGHGGLRAELSCKLSLPGPPPNQAWQLFVTAVGTAATRIKRAQARQLYYSVYRFPQDQLRVAHISKRRDSSDGRRIERTRT